MAVLDKPLESLRFGAVPFRLIPLTDGTSAIQLIGQQRTVTVPHDLGRALAACSGFRPLGEHLASVQRTGVPDPVAARSLLSTLVVSGLLKSLDDVGPATSEGRRSARRITSIGIVTADRPIMLKRCLETLLAEISRRDWTVRIVVVDGSRHNSSSSHNRRLAEELGQRNPIAYIGHPEAEGLRRRLDCTHQAAIDVALTPGDVGPNRNILHLVTAGEHILCCDDDVQCIGRSQIHGEPQLALSGHIDLRICRFFKSRHAAGEFSDALAEVDALRAHEALLGKDLPRLWREATDHRWTCQHFVRLLAAPEQSSVRITMSGIIGDAGVFCPYGLLFSTGPTKDHLLKDQEALRIALANRELARIAPVNFVTHEPACMLYCAGVANDTPLAPFIPRSLLKNPG